jgi:hypothetical protein
MVFGELNQSLIYLAHEHRFYFPFHDDCTSLERLPDKTLYKEQDEDVVGEHMSCQLKSGHFRIIVR